MATPEFTLWTGDDEEASQEAGLSGSWEVVSYGWGDYFRVNLESGQTLYVWLEGVSRGGSTRPGTAPGDLAAEVPSRAARSRPSFKPGQLKSPSDPHFPRLG